MLFFLKKFKNQKMTGFTLAEILIYITVLIIIVSAVSSFVIWSIRSDIKTKAMRETLYSAERAMSIIAHEIKEAKSIYFPTSFFNSHPGQLSLEINKYFLENEESSYLDFYLCENQICFKKQGQDPHILILNNIEISNLIFEKIEFNSIPTIKVIIEANYKNPHNRPEYLSQVKLTSTFSLRSY